MMVCLILTHNVIRIYHKSCWHQLSYCGLHVSAVSVFGKKSNAVCSFLAYFCAVLRFSDPPLRPPQLSTKRSSNIGTITLLKHTSENDFKTNTETTLHHFITKNTETRPSSANTSGLLKTRILTTSFHGISFHQAQPTIAQVKDAISALKRDFWQSADLICHHLTNALKLYLLPPQEQSIAT